MREEGKEALENEIGKESKACSYVSIVPFCLTAQVYICVSSVYALVLTVTRGLSTLTCRGKECNNGSNTLAFIFLVIECIIFALFTIIIFCDQVGEVFSLLAKPSDKKKKKEETKRERERE